MGTRFGAFALVALVFALAVTSTAVAQASSPLVSHGPILIDGDSDLCNVDDVKNGMDVADGITNCATADGSSQRPYVISGWNVTWDPAGPCRIEPSPLLCQPLPPCSTSSVPAAVAICGTRKHILVSGVDIGNAEVARKTQQPRIPAAAIVLSNVDNVRLFDVNARAGGIALLIEAGKPVPTLPERTGPVLVDGLKARSWTENVESTVGLPPSFQILPELSLLHIIDTPVVLRHINVDASLRDVAVTANASNEMTLFELTDSLVANGSSTAGLNLFSLDATIERNRFEAIGVGAAASGPADVASAVIVVHGGTITIRQNEFALRGDGISLRGTPAGHIRENRFAPEPQGMDSAVLKQAEIGCADVRFSYNDLLGGNVENGGTCALDARYNWWNGEPRVEGGAPGENSGAVETTPALSRSISELPVVEIATPSQGTQVHGKILLSGTTRLPEDVVLDRIEASASESEWELNQSAAAGPTWQLVWDVAGEPLGPFSLFVRACAAGDDCGLPTRLDVLVIEKPLAPIAVFEATPRVVLLGDPVRFDASLSYSPQGRPLAGFRFDLGNGNMTDWQTSPVYEARFFEAGNYPASVQVVDAQALVSENLPQHVIRVQGDQEGPGGGNIPFPASALILVALAGLVLVMRGRP